MFLIDNASRTNVAMNTTAGTIADITVILGGHVRQVTSP